MSTADAKKLGNKLTEWVKGQGGKQQKRGKPWSWIAGLVVAAIAMLTIGIMYWRAWRQGKELAKLKHERDVAEQNKARAEVEDRVARNEEEAKKLLEEAAAADKRAAAIDAKLKEAADAKTKTDEDIDALKNWRDVDRYLSGGSDDNGGS
jgi:septal ring factor EnvC (AmiA/AmiB activator)